VQIKLATSLSERLTAFRFRYSVIVEELGVMIPSANHSEKLIRDADDEHGHVFIAFIDGEPVGTARINFVRDGEIVPHSNLLQLSLLPTPKAISASSRFLVARRHRGSLLAIRIVQAVYRFMRQSAIEFDFILVEPNLVRLYERIGYRLHGATVEHPEIGSVTPLCLSTFDESHLRSIQSPLLQCLKDFPAKTVVDRS
jgi:GNAT superfamily N-acetyltransferase